MRKRMVKFSVGIMLTGTLTCVSVVVRDVLDPMWISPEVPGTPTPTTLPTMLGNAPLLLITNGQLVLYDRPGSTRVQRVVEGALISVRVRQSVEVAGVLWFHVETVEQRWRGWISADQLLQIQVDPEKRLSNFQFCLGTATGPMSPCGVSLPLPTEALWLRWQFQGLAPGDQLQRILLVNGEQYASPIEVWDGPAQGDQLVNLLELHPRLESGQWTVQFLLNGDLLADTSVQIRAQ